MKMYVEKRDGRITEFNKQKIVDAILAAFKNVDNELTEYSIEKATNIADYIKKHYEEQEKNIIPKIEEIQDLVEKGLMATKRKDVAKAYILYREERTKARQAKTKIMKVIKEKIEASNVQNQNANVDEHSFGGRAGEARDELLKDYALKYLISEKSKENHLNNEIYIHDLSSYALGNHNCLTVPFDDLLAKGFNTRQTDVRPARSINTAFQLVAVIFQLQSLQQFGGVSASHIDWTMIPYVRMSFYKHFKDGLKYIAPDPYYKEEDFNSEMSIEDEQYKKYPKTYQYAMDMTEKELMQAVQGMYHNLEIWA